MSATIDESLSAPSTLDTLVASACRIIAPSWPLDRQIAVNPYWGQIDRPFEQAAATIHRLAGGRFALPAREYLRAWRSGEISASALARAIAEHGDSATTEHAVAALHAGPQAHYGLPLLSDVIDQRTPVGAAPRWCDTITQQISQYCASHFDEHQADWHRGRAYGLFEGWRRGLQFDHALQPLMHAPEIRARAHALPETADAALAWSLDRLGVPAEDSVEFLQTCLLRINGWAAWCAYLGWEAQLAGTTDPHLQELLAIRVSWEALLHDGRDEDVSPGRHWREQWLGARGAKPLPATAWELIWQRAHEISYQERLIGALDPSGTPAPAEPRPTRCPAQLVFCIDVRSERFRRALEKVDPALQTLGFAGFFGLAIRYAPIGAQPSRPQLPGLLAPSLDATDTTGDPGADAAIEARRASRFAKQASWQPFARLPSGTFSLVETLGVGYAGAILRRHFGHTERPIESLGLDAREQRALHPHLRLADDGGADATADLVASILRAMSLTDGFARLLVLVGHGSQSANNPQAAALDCGACGGQTGEVNARILAGLLNDPSLRAALAQRGIRIPADTLAVGALHNTTTDEVRLFDVEQLPGPHAPDLEQLRRNLHEAGHATRTERAPSLGLADHVHRPDALLKRIRRRARDWAETRPEWGLAGNAAFIVAPRSRTRGLDLAGRSFLHDYVAADDPDGKVLELLLTAPMVVTHWINLQYFASTVDPDRFGSGNKVLHNVACGRIGVFEGNTGDLRIGLARQSLHDGQRWMHAPLRLSVFVDAPRARIDRILERHATVRHLVEHRWLHLFRFGESGIEWCRDRCWQAWSPQSHER
jgi:hypothetical protein